MWIIVHINKHYIVPFDTSCYSFVIMHLTNVVVQGRLDRLIDLRALAGDLTNVKYDPSTFSGLTWQHRRIGGNCKVFASGAIHCNGKCHTFKEAIRRLRRYARILQKNGHCTSLKHVKIITASACHRLEGTVKVENIPFACTFEPELFPAIMFRRKKIHFTLHFSGALIITGIKREKDMNRIVYPVILELTLCL